MYTAISIEEAKERLDKGEVLYYCFYDCDRDDNKMIPNRKVFRISDKSLRHTYLSKGSVRYVVSRYYFDEEEDFYYTKEKDYVPLTEKEEGIFGRLQQITKDK